MTYKNISEKVQSIIKHSQEDYITFDDKDKNNVKYNQRDTVKRINYYINDKYLERDDDSLFWNISNSRIVHSAKLLGVDTKDFMPYGRGEYNFVQAWALRRKLKAWFDETQFYQILNDISEGLAIYGSAVWKKCYKDGKPYLEEVMLDNLYFDQKAKSIKKTPVVETHVLSEEELYEKMDVWTNVKEVLNDKKDDYDIWEFYGYALVGDETEPVKRHVIGYGFGDRFVQLFEEEVDEKDNLYFDFRLGKYKKRWMGIGVVERLFKLQARVNQLVNQNAQSTEIASLLLFRSQMGDSIGNVLEQAVNGQIIDSADLEQIGITNTGLQQFVQEMQMIEQQANALCLTPEILQGESSPSNTTFRGIAVVNSAAVSAFTAYKQDVGENIAHILLTEILPDICKDWDKEIIIDIAEDDADIEMYDKSLAQEMEKRFLLEGRGAVTEEVRNGIKMTIDENIKYVGRKVKMDKGWINFKYGIKMMPTNETVDKAAQNDAYFNALTMVGANPMVVNIPLFKQYLENNGISWWKLTPKQTQDILQAQQMGQASPELRQPDKLLTQAQPVNV